MKALRMLIPLLALTGCGQAWEPENRPRTATPHTDPEVFGSTPHVTEYRTSKYEALRYTLTMTLALGEAAGTNTQPCIDQALDLETECPVADPVAFLDANRDQLGAPSYPENPQDSKPEGLLTAGGFKSWSLASSSACGRMMTEQAVPALFPGDFPGSDPYIDDYETAFLALLGRLPTDLEAQTLDNVQMATSPVTGMPYFPDITKRGAAVCTVLLGSLEFIGAN